MVIAACSCGARFDAKPELAGKTVQCPKCSQPLTIPQANPAPAAPTSPSPAAPKSPAPAASNTSVSCACGAKLSAPPSLRGKQVKCPKCGNPIAIPGPANQGMPAAPTPMQTPNPLQQAPNPLQGQQPIPQQQPLAPQPGMQPMQQGGMRAPLGGPMGQPGQLPPMPMMQPGQMPGPPMGGQPMAGQPMPGPPGAPPGAIPGFQSAPAGPRQVKRKKKKKASGKRRGRNDELDLSMALMIMGGVLTVLGIVGLVVPVFGALFAVGFLVLSYIVGMIGGICLLVKAFTEEVICGILCLIVPFYGLYFLFTRWEDTAMFQIPAAGILMQICAVIYLVVLGAVHGSQNAMLTQPASFMFF